MSETLIHESAVVHPEAQLGSGVEIGPFCYVGAKVQIGDRTKLISNVRLDGPMKLGIENLIYPFASLGSEPQDLKFRGETVSVEIGDKNTFRECTTVNRGTETGGGVTRIGDNNLFMAYSHVAHDDVIGNSNVIANSTQLAGHVTLGSFVVIGGACAIQQFVRLGDHAYIGGATSLLKDVPPFCIAYGNRGRVTGVNVIGLKRRGFSREEIVKIQEGQRIFFKQRLHVDESMKKLEALSNESAGVKIFYTFIKESKVGITPGRDAGDGV